MLFQNRHHSAELLLAGVGTLCDEEDNNVDLGGGVIVDVSEACAILGAWDATNDLDRVGPHIWREFWSRVNNTPNLWAVPFDASDPVNTPRTKISLPCLSFTLSKIRPQGSIKQDTPVLAERTTYTLFSTARNTFMATY